MGAAREDEMMTQMKTTLKGRWMEYDTARPARRVRGVRAADSREAARHDGGAGVVVAADGRRVYWQD